MRQFLIFTFLFPPLALAVFTAPDGFTNILAWLGYAYLFATVLAWLTMAVDSKLSAKPNHVRIVGTTLSGAVLTGSIALFLGGGDSEFLPVLMAVLVGAIPAGACSWLSRTA